MVTAFVVLTSVGVWWAAPSGDLLVNTKEAFGRLHVPELALLVAIALGAIAAEMFRLFVFGRVIGQPVSTRAAFDASIANDLFSWISPGGLAGEPASVFMLHRRGVPIEGALTITFAKFATSFAMIYGAGAVLLALGYGPPIPGWAIASIVATIAFGVVLCGSFVAGAIWPGPTTSLLSRIEAWLLRRWLLRGPLATEVVTSAVGVARRSIDRLGAFRTLHAAGWLAILASHILYYAVYVGLLVYLAYLFDARSLAVIVPIATIYQGFTFIAPAPGIPEASAAMFFGSQLTDLHAVAVVLLFRALTAYLQVALGLIYLPVIGAMRALLTKR
jgi:uncharacterized protein (TIRG00374 family)